MQPVSPGTPGSLVVSAVARAAPMPYAKELSSSTVPLACARMSLHMCCKHRWPSTRLVRPRCVAPQALGSPIVCFQGLKMSLYS